MRIRLILALVLALRFMTSSYAAARVTGTFTNLHYNAEGGDLLGFEILIIPAAGDREGYVAFVQLAKGGGPNSALVPIQVSGDSVKFSMPASGDYAGLCFNGAVGTEGLIGTWSNGNREILKRHASYWG